MKWQPIETAPKDGTDIIVMHVHISTQIVHAAFWIDEEQGLDKPGDTGWWSYDKSEGSRIKLDDWLTPTHWMPLPEPPNVSRETQEEVKSWQSVETAPKDGTYILGCGNSNGGVVVGLVRWRDECWKLPHGSEVEVISWRPISPGHQEEIVSRETQEWD